MIELKEISYVRLGTPDLEMAETFATRCLGLEVGDRSAKGLYLRSDDRTHTLYYSEGDPEKQTIGFEVDGETQLQDAAATLEALGHPVHAGTPDECASRMVKAFIGFKDPTGNCIELVVRPARSGRRYFPTRHRNYRL
ncbi:VOC family protein [Bradyrhizobium sp. RDT10]